MARPRLSSARKSHPESVAGPSEQAVRQRADASAVPPRPDTASETDPLLSAHAVDDVERNAQGDSGAQELAEKLLQPRTFLTVLTTILLPWVVFAAAVLTVTLAHHPNQYVRVLAVFTFAGVFLLGFFLAFRVKQFKASILSLLCAIAVVLGALAGGVAYCSGAIDYWAFDEHWQYTNVWPTELAAAHRDASALVFAQGTAPDARKVAGYTVGGHTYCVAPITMRVSLGIPDIQYWAAGRDCCEGDERFTCDDAGLDSARAGLVLRNRTFEFYSAFVTHEVDYYAEAARHARVKFNIVSTEEQPIFVRWVWDLDAGRVDFWRRSRQVGLEIILGYLPVSVVLSLFTPALRMKSLA